MPKGFLLRVFLAPDDGGGTGGDAGGGMTAASAAAAMAGGGQPQGGAPGAPPPGGQPGGQPGAAPPTRPDFLIDGYNSPEDQARAYAEMVRQYGGPAALKQYVQWGQGINERATKDPRFVDDFRGLMSRDPAAPTPVPKEVAFLDYDEQTLDAFREMFERKLQPNDPRYNQVAPKYDQHGKFMTNFWLQPHNGLKTLLQHPVVQEAIRGIVQPTLQQNVQPLQQQMEAQQRDAFLSQHAEELDNLLPEVADMLENRVYGMGAQAVLKAIETSNKIRQAYNIPRANAGQPPPPRPGQQPPRNGQPPRGQQPPKAPPREDDGKESVRSFARKMAGVE